MSRGKSRGLYIHNSVEVALIAWFQVAQALGHQAMMRRIVPRPIQTGEPENSRYGTKVRRHTRTVTIHSGLDRIDVTMFNFEPDPNSAWDRTWTVDTVTITGKTGRKEVRSFRYRSPMLNDAYSSGYPHEIDLWDEDRQQWSLRGKLMAPAI